MSQTPSSESRPRTLTLAPLVVFIALGGLWISRRDPGKGVRADPTAPGEDATSRDEVKLHPPGAESGPPPLNRIERGTPPTGSGLDPAAEAELASLVIRVIDEFGEPWDDLRVDVGSHRHMTITLDDEGKPVTDLEEFLGRTDAEGVVQFDGLKPKRARIEVDDADDKPWFEEVDLPPGETTDCEVVIVRSKAIQGRVVDIRGNPQAGAAVGLYKHLSSYDLGQGSRHNQMFTDPRSSSTNQESGMLTNGAGEFALRAPIEPGEHEYILAAKHEGFILTGLPLPEPNGHGVFPPIEVVLDDPVTLRGTVHYGDGSPGLGVDMLPLGGHMATQIIAWIGERDVDAEGRFEIKTRPEVTHLSYGGPGGHSIEVPLGSVQAGDIREFELTWTPPEGTAVIWFHGVAGEILKESSPLLDNLELHADRGPGPLPMRWLIDSAPELIEIPRGGKTRVTAQRAGSDVSSRVFVEPGDVAHMVLDDDPAATERSLTFDIAAPPGSDPGQLAQELWGVRVRLGGLEGPVRSGPRDPKTPGAAITVSLGRWPAGPVDISWVGMTRPGAPYSILGRTTVSIPEEGDPPPIDITALPCFHIDSREAPEEFFYGDPPGFLELLDGRGDVLWRYPLGFEFAHGQVIHFPRVPDGSARLRRGEEVLEIEEPDRTEPPD